MKHNPIGRVTLSQVDDHNRAAVLALDVHESQKDLVTGNDVSLAEAKPRPHYQPRAIYLDEQLVGFVLYSPMEPLAAPVHYQIFRFMVDAKSQGLGIGRRALELVLAEVSAINTAMELRINYVPENTVARSLYRSFGFTEIGLDQYGEMVARIVIRNAEEK
jgi:diamine N-acetyltransferase